MPDPGEDSSAAVQQPLTNFQLEVAQVFFSLSTSKGFLLAGGAALAAQYLSARPTQDLDIFASPDHGHVREARDGFESAVRERGWSSDRIRDAESFCRLVISGTEDVLVDLAIDGPPAMAPIASIAGPTFAHEELAARKVVALFDRAEARDFVDVYMLTQRFSKDLLLARAQEIDPGLDIGVFRDMLRAVNRFSSRDFPTDQQTHGRVRDFAETWAGELE